MDLLVQIPTALVCSFLTHFQGQIEHSFKLSAEEQTHTFMFLVYIQR